MAAASEYVLEPIRDGAGFTLYRARQRGNEIPLLIVAPAAEQPLLQSLRRLEHEYSLAAELEPAWAAKPLALTRHEGRTILVLADPGANRSTAFSIGTGKTHSMCLGSSLLRLAWRRRSATCTSAV
jgi:hypothetical protein